MGVHKVYDASPTVSASQLSTLLFHGVAYFH